MHAPDVVALKLICSPLCVIALQHSKDIEIKDAGIIIEEQLCAI
jgi:hypothetical protein